MRQTKPISAFLAQKRGLPPKNKANLSRGQTDYEPETPY